MSFNISLSGVNAAQKDLDVTSNNIANVNTTGFKESRAEFGDVYAASLLSNNSTKAGDGVITTDVAQQFHQGAIEFTNNALDLAVTGSGFFVTSPDISGSEYSYTRSGAFKLNSEGFVVNSNGDHLMGFPVNPDGTSSSVALSTTEPVLIPDSSGSPQLTTTVEKKMNLPAGDAILDPTALDITDPDTYNSATSVTIYDSLGDSHVQTFYYVKQAANTWEVFTSVDGTLVDVNGGDATGGRPSASGQLTFDTSGNMIGQAPDPMTTVALGGAILSNGADPTQTITIDYSFNGGPPTAPSPDMPTQFASSFEVTSLEQDGLPVGRLTGIEIGTDGLVRATYSNGTSQPLSRVALTRFANEQGLTQIGNTSWKESISSGEPLAGEATTGTFGNINSSALEQSNVNLTNELIDLIEAQRNFQANSRGLEVSNQLDQTILQIR